MMRAASRMRIERFNVDTESLEVRVRNPDADRAVILAAGQGALARRLNGFANYLAHVGDLATFQIELPGRGRSGGTPTYDHDVDAITALATQLRNEMRADGSPRYRELYGVGHSLGSVELLDAAIDTPFERIVAIGHPIVMQDAQTRRFGLIAERFPWLARLGGRLVDTMKRREAEKQGTRYISKGAGGLKAGELPGALASYLRAPELEDQLAALRDAHPETRLMFIYGSKDTYSDPGIVRRELAPRLTERDELLIINGVNHGLNPLTYPGDWIEKRGAGTRGKKAARQFFS